MWSKQQNQKCSNAIYGSIVLLITKIDEVVAYEPMLFINYLELKVFTEKCDSYKQLNSVFEVFGRLIIDF